MAITQSQYDEIMRNYDQIQFRAKREQSKRIEEITSKIPELEAIQKEISGMSVRTIRQLFETPSDQGMNSYKERLRELHERKEKLLLAYGYTLDDLAVHYECEECKDTGLVDGKKCRCFKKKEIELLYDQSNIKHRMEVENFNTFTMDCYDNIHVEAAIGKTPRKHMEDVVRVCHQFVDEFAQPQRQHRNLLFYGETGVGKTFLTNCIAKELIEKAQLVVYLSAIQLFSIFSDDEFSRNDEQARNQVRRILDCDLLIIDDLGTELGNSFTNSALFNCLNERMIAERATIVSTNLVKFSELTERYSERVTSRLLKEYTFLRIYGDDLRRKKKN